MKMSRVMSARAVFMLKASARIRALATLRNYVVLSKHEKMELVEESLKAAALWKEVSHRLDSPAHTLSLGQQQRLCIARTLAIKPDILLLDEPTASVDPVSARALENLILELKENYTVIMVTHDIRQTRRIADYVMFLCEGEMIEIGENAHMFSKMAKEKTRLYLSEVRTYVKRYTNRNTQGPR